MASLAQSSLTHFTFLIFLLSILQLMSQNMPTARHVHDNHKSQTGFRVTLKRIDSAENITKFEHLQRAMVRGRNRLQKLSLMHLASSSSGNIDSSKIESPVHAGQGEFLMQLAIGTPPESFSAIMDTGSDLIWTQCKPCMNCFPQFTPVFDPVKSSSFSQLPCNNSFCRAIPSASCSNNACQYAYFYGDSSSTKGILGTETLKFGKALVNNVAFGCGLDNKGSGFKQAAGLVGLGRGPLSLISQLEQPKFSYCLTSFGDSTPSTLMIGSSASMTSIPSITTPLIKNPRRPTFYYLSLQAITVGATRIPITTSTFGIKNDGTGGLIIDSGTTITYLEQNVFDLVTKAFISQVSLPVDSSGSAGLDLCFGLPNGGDTMHIPKLTFNFKGGDLLLPAENYMIKDSNIACLVMGNSGNSGISIFGNYQQQNLLVLHDLQKEAISFAHTKCNKL